MLRRNIFANFSGRYTQVALSILSIPVYVHLLGVEAYGVIGFFISCQALFLLFDLGIGGTLAREMACYSIKNDNSPIISETLRTFEWIYIGISLFAAMLSCILIFFFGSGWFNSTHITQETIITCLYLMVAALVLQLPIGLYNSGLVGLQRLVLLNLSNIFFMILRVIGSILLMWLYSNELPIFFVWQIISNLLQVLFLKCALWHVLPRDSIRRFNWEILKKLWRYAAGLSGSSIIVVFLGQIDKILLSTLLPLHYFGYYMLANTLAQSLTLIAAPMGDVLFSKYTQLYMQGKIQEFKKLYLKAFELLMIMILPFGGILFFYSDFVLNIWVGDKIDIQTTSFLTSFLVIGVTLNVAISTLDSVQMAMGSLKSSLIVRGVALLIALPIFYFSIYFLNLYGGPIGWGIIYSLYFLWLPHLVLKGFMLDARYDWYKIFLKYLIISFSIPMVSWWLSNLFPFTSVMLKFFFVFFTGVITSLFCISASRDAREIASSLYSSIKVYLEMRWKNHLYRL